MPPKPKSQKPKPPQPNTSKTNEPPKPNWPPLRPVLPAADLTLTPLLYDQIYLINNFLTSTLCKTLVSFLSSLPLSTTPGKPKRGDAVRVNDRFQIEDHRFAEALWEGTALKELVLDFEEEEDEDDEDDEGNEAGEKKSTRTRTRTMKEIWGGQPLGLNPNIRIYRYSRGQFFAKHYDDSNSLTYPTKSNPSQSARTTWTLLVYLSVCQGGETVFYPEATRANRKPEPVSVAPEMGLGLLHRHGERCLLHEGMGVTEGEKWVLRSDLVVSR